MLLIQRCFWVGTTDDPSRDRADRHARPTCSPRGFAHARRQPRPARHRASWSSAGSRASSRSGCDAMTTSIVRRRRQPRRSRMRYHRTIKQMSVAMVRGQDISDTFMAVDDVSFTVEQGESIGLMGLNGSGKSTLLKMINGVMKPDGGSVLHPRPDRRPDRHRRRLPPPAHRPREPLPQRRDPRHEREGDQPQVRRDRRLRRHRSTASTPRSATTPPGMFARLGFAIAVHVDSDIFLADEVLAVGDKPFKRKCMAKMQRDPRRAAAPSSTSATPPVGPRGCATGSSSSRRAGSASTAPSRRASTTSTTTATTRTMLAGERGRRATTPTPSCGADI